MPLGRNRLVATLGVTALAAALAGCSGYLEHNDTVSSSAGDAVDANIAIQTIDPWPRAAAKTEILSNGVKPAAAASPAATTSATTATAATIKTTTTDQSSSGE